MTSKRRVNILLIFIFKAFTKKLLVHGTFVGEFLRLRLVTAYFGTALLHGGTIYTSVLDLF